MHLCQNPYICNRWVFSDIRALPTRLRLLRATSDAVREFLFSTPFGLLMNVFLMGAQRSQMLMAALEV